MSKHIGSCHCGAITLELRSDPTNAAECNCSLCRRLGVLWHHCSPTLVTVTGEAAGYVQGDCSLTIWHCGTCGNTSHWTALDDASSDRMAVNLRLFDPGLWVHLPRRLIDGASF